MKHEHHECEFCNWINRVPLKTKIPIDIDISVNWEWIYNYFKKYPDATFINFKHDVAMLLELEDQTLLKVSPTQR